MNSWKSTLLSACAPAVEDVHHRHRKDVRAVAAEVAPQRQPLLGGGRVRGGQRDAEDRVRAQARLVRRAVERDERRVEAALVVGVEAGDRRGDLAVDVRDRLRDALAAPGLAAVAQLGRLELARRGARRHGRAAGGAGAQDELDLDGRVAAAVEDLAGVNAIDLAHGVSISGPGRRRRVVRRSGRSAQRSPARSASRLGRLDAAAEAGRRRPAARARDPPCSLRATFTVAKSDVAHAGEQLVAVAAGASSPRAPRAVRVRPRAGLGALDVEARGGGTPLDLARQQRRREVLGHLAEDAAPRGRAPVCLIASQLRSTSPAVRAPRAGPRPRSPRARRRAGGGG